MSWNPINDMKKLFNKFKDAAKDAVNSVKNEANKAKNSLNWVKDQAKKEIYKVKDDCKKWVEESAKKVEDKTIGEIKEFGETVKHEAESEFNKVKGEIVDLKEDAEGAFKKVENEIEKLPDKAEEAFKDVIKEAQEIAEKTFDEIEDALISSSFKAAAKKTLAIAKIGSPSSVDFSLQCVVGIQCEFNVQSVLSEFQKWIDNPPTDNESIKNFFIALAPDSVRVFGGGELSLGIQVAAEGGVTYQKEDFINNFDEILKAFS